MVGWKLRYDDDSVVTSRTTSWADAPDDGILHLMIFYKGIDHQGRNRRLSIHGDSSYFSDGDQFFGSNNDSEAETIARYPRRTLIFKRGRWTTTVEMDRTRQAAMADYDLTQ